MLHALKVTTHAIISVSNCLLSPMKTASVDHGPAGLPARVTPHKRVEKQRISSGTDRVDSEPLARIHRAALDMLAVLRELKESACVPLSDDTYDTSSDRSSQSRVASPPELSDVPTDSSFSVSVMRMGGRRESILVWDEEKDDFNVDGTNACRGSDGMNGSYLAVAWLYR
jgi:hypothetical protein